MSTPALARAKDAFVVTHDARADDPSLTYSEFLDLLLHAAVSAALHDPDDPDSLARGLYDEMRKGTITPPWEEAHPTTQEGFRYEARCFVAAILGEAS